MQTAEPQRLSLRVVCFILLAPLFVLVACGPLGYTPEEDTLRAGAGMLQDRGPVVTVSQVVDGDTVEVTPAVDGLTKVRLIGVDTPETSHPTYGEQPYGQQAKEFVERASKSIRTLPTPSNQQGKTRLAPVGREVIFSSGIYKYGSLRPAGLPR